LFRHSLPGNFDGHSSSVSHTIAVEAEAKPLAFLACEALIDAFESAPTLTLTCSKLSSEVHTL
jgi:hypothetical protein